MSFEMDGVDWVDVVDDAVRCEPEVWGLLDLGGCHVQAIARRPTGRPRRLGDPPVTRVANVRRA